LIAIGPPIFDLLIVRDSNIPEAELFLLYASTGFWGFGVLGFWGFGFWFALISPVPPPSSGDWSGDVGEDCLSTWTRSGSCEFRSRLARRATQGTSKRWRIGDRLLLVTFLGEARKVTSGRATPGKWEYTITGSD